ncbi:MAG: hypothetical protein Ct9H300mP2_2210 [Candidatus Neomarinimicrobiota bacterium]|nr:MAG: hypothetical protein Ct9H300mP2_2210 [Candidatus Neomarinimicrobiota bacterium]
MADRGYAGVGSSKISTVPDVYIYDKTGANASSDTVLNTNPLFVPSIEGKITISLGAATVDM